MYEGLIDQWLGDEITGEARTLATAVVGKVIERGLDGDMVAVQWLGGKVFLMPVPNINVQFTGGEAQEEG